MKRSDIEPALKPRCSYVQQHATDREALKGNKCPDCPQSYLTDQGMSGALWCPRCRTFFVEIGGFICRNRAN